MAQSEMTEENVSARQKSSGGVTPPIEYVAAIYFTALVTAASFVIEPLIGYRAIAILYLLLVVALGMKLRRGPVLLVAASSALAWNFFFIPTRFSLHIVKIEDLMMFAMFFVVAMAMGHLTTQLRRLRAIQRRAPFGTEDAYFEAGHLAIDFNSHTVTVKGREVKLTATEYALLKLLALHAGKLVTHKQLLREVWGPNAEKQSQYLRVYMMHLRKKIEIPEGGERLLRTESGIGYRLVIPPHNRWLAERRFEDTFLGSFFARIPHRHSRQRHADSR